MFRNFLILMVLFGVGLIGCDDAVAPTGSGTGDETIDVISDDASWENLDVGVEVSSVEEDTSIDAGPATDVVPIQSQVDSTEEESESASGGDPTENPQGTEFFEFAAWEIPTPGQDEEDNR